MNVPISYVVQQEVHRCIRSHQLSLSVLKRFLEGRLAFPHVFDMHRYYRNQVPVKGLLTSHLAGSPLWRAGAEARQTTLKGVTPE